MIKQNSLEVILFLSVYSRYLVIMHYWYWLLLNLVIELCPFSLTFCFSKLERIIVICSSFRLDHPTRINTAGSEKSYQTCSQLNYDWLHELHCNLVIFFSLRTLLLVKENTTTSRMKAKRVWCDKNIIANDLYFCSWIQLKKTMPTISRVQNQKVQSVYMCSPCLFQCCSDSNWNSYSGETETSIENLEQ